MPRLTRPPLTLAELQADGPPIRVRDLVAITSLCADTISQDIVRGELSAIRRGPKSPILIERAAARTWLAKMGFGVGGLLPMLVSEGTDRNRQPPIFRDPQILVEMFFAMGLGSVIRNAVANVDAITGGEDGLQVSITHRAWTARDKYNKPTYASAVTRKAVMKSLQRMIRTTGGQEVLARASLTFLTPITANGAEGRREPVDPRDLITLPDGTTGPILDVTGTVDPETDAPYALKVILG
jgi:hypothetical protein